MKCKVVQQNWIGYVENVLPEREMADIRSHLSSCADCNRLISEVSATYVLTQSMQKHVPNPYFYAALESRLKQTKKSATIVPLVAMRWMPMVASFLILIAIGTGIFVGKTLSNISSTATSEVSAAKSTSDLYASEYYLTNTGEESIESLINYK
jgi:hypothetical protein